MRLLIFLIPIVLGSIIGFYPPIRDFAHLNVLVIIPIGGLFQGMIYTWGQIKLMNRFDIQYSQGMAIFMAVSCLLGFLAVDTVAYYVSSVDFENYDGSKSQVRLNEIMSLFGYFQFKFSNTTINIGSEVGPGMVLGSKAATGYYLIELAQVALVPFSLRFINNQRNPFCEKCGKYYKVISRFKTCFRFDESKIQDIKDRFAQDEDLLDLKALREGAEYYSNLYQNNEKGSFKVEFQEVICVHCGDSVFMASSFQKDGDHWSRTDDVSIRQVFPR